MWQMSAFWPNYTRSLVWYVGGCLFLGLHSTLHAFFLIWTIFWAFLCLAVHTMIMYSTLHGLPQLTSWWLLAMIGCGNCGSPVFYPCATHALWQTTSNTMLPQICQQMECKWSTQLWSKPPNFTSTSYWSASHQQVCCHYGIEIIHLLLRRKWSTEMG